MKLALAGDTTLGRKVADRLVADPQVCSFCEEVVDVAQDANRFL
jgi:hypothetical protein